MVKKLRSLIQEMIPIDLRVDIDLLSRRRDISNAEKQEELFKLLRQYNINDITPLGSGTNRYAFKLNGFVIKVATDHDGVIDNKKEFKMAKRLYPHVIKIYEVSENGTLLVCEYIQPFQSYSEMMAHADQIRDILKELSSVYLIGDVGITRKNYANWGLRVGSDVPVCLDFAYVYEVKSELFVCRYCKTNSMLLPNTDFTELYCPAPGCGKKYTFEDIRAKLGNDLHRHEIGDLSEEGYRLTESNVETELTLDRSNYLVKKKNIVETKEDEPKEKPIKDEFFIPYEEPKQQEENTMTVIKATATIIDSAKGNMNVSFNVKPEPVEEQPVVEKEEPKLAFSTTIPVKVEIIDDINKSADTEPEHTQEPEPAKPTVVFSTAIDTTPEVKETQAVETQEKPKNKKPVKVEVPKKPEVVEEANVGDATSVPNFGKNFGLAVSKFSSRIATWLDEIDVFEEIKNDVKSKNKKFMTTEDIKQLYDNTQKAFYHAITEFCSFEKTEGTREDGSTYTKYVPVELLDMPYTPTVVFIDRFFNDRYVWGAETTEEALERYRKKYKDFNGIQNEFVEILRRRLKSKLHILTDTGNAIMANIIIDKWVTDDAPIGPDDNETSAEVDNSNEVVSEPVEEPVTDETVAEPTAEETESAEDEVDTFTDSSDEVAETPEDEESEEEEEMDDDEAYPESNYPLKVDIHHDDIGDCVRVTQSDFYGMIAIPFYCNWNAIEAADPLANEIHTKNGDWDWLGFLVPDMRFQTKNPDKWMAGNDSYAEQTKIIILDEDDDEKEFLMGVYIVDSINEYDVDGTESNAFNEETVRKLNTLIGGDLAAIHNHLVRSVGVDDNVYTEEYMESMLNKQCDDEFGDEDDDDESSDLADKELAAFEALMGADADNKPDDNQEIYGSPVDIREGGDIPDRFEPSEEDLQQDEYEEEIRERDRQKQIARQKEHERQTRDMAIAEAERMLFKPIRRKDRDKDRDRDRDFYPGR